MINMVFNIGLYFSKIRTVLLQYFSFSYENSICDPAIKLGFPFGGTKNFEGT